MSTAIEWTRGDDGALGKTWNPVTGCSKVSPGCAHCYAETVANRFWAKQYPHTEVMIGSPEATNQSTWTRPRVFTDVMCHEDRLDAPLHWSKPRRVFVNSMSDLFHEDVPDEFIDRVFAVIALTPQHTYQILTKRAERQRDYMQALDDGKGGWSLPQRLWDAFKGFSGEWPTLDNPWPLGNVWLGVSVENQRFADERIPLLLQTPGAVRFVSAEPLLGPVDFSEWLGACLCRLEPHGKACPYVNPALDWLIVGGESGRCARPFDLSWVRSIIRQCRFVGLPVFVKQMGSRPIYQSTCKDDDRDATCGCGPLTLGLNLRNRKGGDLSEWPADLRVREWPEARR